VGPVDPAAVLDEAIALGANDIGHLDEGPGHLLEPPGMFDALEAGDFQSIEGIVTQLASYFNPSPTAGPRTRGSVRRASGFVQIPISLVDSPFAIF
jgi:hypothetical protein